MVKVHGAEGLEIRMNWNIPWVHFGKVLVAFGIDIFPFSFILLFWRFVVRYFISWSVGRLGIGRVAEAACVCLVISRSFSSSIFLVFGLAGV